MMSFKQNQPHRVVLTIGAFSKASTCEPSPVEQSNDVKAMFHYFRYTTTLAYCTDIRLMSLFHVYTVRRRGIEPVGS